MYSAKKCCPGYNLTDNHCLKVNPLNPCQSRSCPSEPSAQCTVYKKCGQEIAVFTLNGSLVDRCHQDAELDILKCSGVCREDPCEHAACPAFSDDQVICFTTGCACKATWIRLQDRAEVNCETGEALTQEQSRYLRRKREACS